ncbi:MAG: DUF4430 domain-containing protein [Patescibacteria group bacterium]|nr:DUF4430 domain-containing protein [Patescibacteria group bacterium]
MRKKAFSTASTAIVFLAVLLCGVFIWLETDSKAQTDSGLSASVNYLKTQSPDPWNVMALSGAGETTNNLDFLKSVSQEQKSSLTYSKYILALAASGKNPADFGPENYITKLKEYFVNNQFGDETLVNDDIWAILALGSVGQANLIQAQKSKEFVLANQNQDGGWGYQTGSDSDTNDTAAAIMALMEAGVGTSSPALQKAMTFLQASQNQDGGFGYAALSASDSCSNAWVISAIYKSGENPAGLGWTRNSQNPITSLQTFQDASAGGFWWQKPNDNKMCTAFAVLALSGKTYPAPTIFNEHSLRIENGNGTICETKSHSATALGLIIQASGICHYQYAINEYPGLGLYLAEINQKNDWMYLVNNQSPAIGAADYFLSPNDDVLWYPAELSDKDWVMANHRAGLKVEIEQPQPAGENDQQNISFSVSPDALDFGKLKPGSQKEISLNLQNSGVNIRLQTEVSGDDVFKNNLQVSGQIWNDFFWLAEPNQEKQLNLKLIIPADYSGSGGIKNGEITFWATKR